MSSAIFEVNGFQQLNTKLKTLPDRVKRSEVLKVWRPIANNVAGVYRSNLPIGSRSHTRYTSGGGRTTYQPGNLSRSVAVRAVPARFTGGSPSLVIRPGKRGKNDGYYRFMVVPKGFRGSGRGSRSGANKVVTQARNKTLGSTRGRSSDQVEAKTAKVIQRAIDKLSTK